jgi:hypothetical protein
MKIARFRKFAFLKARNYVNALFSIFTVCGVFCGKPITQILAVLAKSKIIIIRYFRLFCSSLHTPQATEAMKIPTWLTQGS